MIETTSLLFVSKLARQTYDKYYNGDLGYCLAG